MICNYQLKVTITIEMTHNNIESRCKHILTPYNYGKLTQYIFSCILKVSASKTNYL